jgi:hypothetical protein
LYALVMEKLPSGMGWAIPRQGQGAFHCLGSNS